MAFLPQKPWQILAIPGGATGSGITAGKIAVAAGAATVAGLILWGSKQYLEQKQQQTGIATAPTDYFFYQTPGGGPINVYNPAGGTATTTQEQKQEATQSTPDYMQIILIGALAIGALYIMTKRSK